MSVPNPNPDRTYDVDHIVKLAAKNLDRGVIEEPRYFFDLITLQPNGLISKDDPSVFLNGEEFPVRITHVGFAIRPTLGEVPIGIDERLLQRCAVRLVFHDQYYQSRDFAPCPLWANKVTSAPQILGRSSVTHVFDRPVILSARDSIRVEVALEAIPETAQRASVGFHGVGLQSQRPYFLHSYRDLANTTPTTLPTADFRNDGAEPIALTQVVVQLAAPTTDPSGVGNVQGMRVAFRQLGNGTGRDWVVYPTIQATGTPLPQIPAHFLGFTQGRSVVHKLPGEGMLFEPNEGITVEAIGLDSSADNLQLGITLAGYIALV